MAQQDSRRCERRGQERLRAECGGPGHQLVFTDRMMATLVVLRFQLPHAALAVFYGVDRSTITRAVHEIRPLLAARGFAVPGEVGRRLHTMAAASCRRRRPAAGPAGLRAPYPHHPTSWPPNAANAPASAL
ncbi:transposase family protein [Streptomyces sp. NPDC002387]|uniref:helix-turn-helix domain-containing protein n=2 Tax=Streptomyces TaxID=1883 RepID=UPI0033B24127